MIPVQGLLSPVFPRFLSGSAVSDQKAMWENMCISYATEKTDFGIKDFFMKQLQQFGGEKSAEAMKVYLTSKEVCSPALAVIIADGWKKH